MSIDPRHYHQPSWRKPVGMLAIVGLITLWAVMVGSLSLGIIWIWVLPLRRLLAWMETGRWRRG